MYLAGVGLQMPAKGFARTRATHEDSYQDQALPSFTYSHGLDN